MKIKYPKLEHVDSLAGFALGTIQMEKVNVKGVKVSLEWLLDAPLSLVP